MLFLGVLWGLVERFFFVGFFCYVGVFCMVVCESDDVVNCKILIVEDDVFIVFYLVKGLIEVGYVVELCGDGCDGLFLVSEGIFDFIIVDWMLLGFDGFVMVSVVCVVGIVIFVLILLVFVVVD